jgi:hypothetical protein
VEGNVVRVPVPKPSKETRDATLKLVSKIAEAARSRIRRVRQAAMDKLKKVEGACARGVFREERCMGRTPPRRPAAAAPARNQACRRTPRFGR